MDSAFETKHWNSRYASGAHSGDGTHGPALALKLAWLAPLKFGSITEIGCGDFHLSGNLLKLHPAKYTGLDVSDFIIHKNEILFPDHTWRVMSNDIPPADLLMCVDVLFHVIEDKDLEHLLTLIEKADWKYLAITGYEHDELKTNHVRIRNFDYKRFGTPVMRRIVEEEGQLYFYIFKRDDKPQTSVGVSDNEGPVVSA